MKLIIVLFILFCYFNNAGASQSFIIAVNQVLKNEGGLANKKHDKGGLTKYGITKQYYPHLDIRNLTKQQAIDIYQKDYWQKIKGDWIKHQSVANYLLDTSIHIGVSGSVKILQNILDVTTDRYGVIDHNTLNALNMMEPKDILSKYKVHKVRYLSKICIRDNTQCRFLPGWIKRAVN